MESFASEFLSGPYIFLPFMIVLLVVLLVITLSRSMAVRKLTSDAGEDRTLCFLAIVGESAKQVKRQIGSFRNECLIENDASREGVLEQFQQLTGETCDLVKYLTEWCSDALDRLSPIVAAAGTYGANIRQIPERLERAVRDPLLSPAPGSNRQELIKKAEEATSTIATEAVEAYNFVETTIGSPLFDKLQALIDPTHVQKMVCDLDAATARLEQLLAKLNSAIADQKEEEEIEDLRRKLCMRSRDLHLACTRASISKVAFNEYRARRAEQALLAARESVQRTKQDNDGPIILRNIMIRWLAVQGMK